MAVPLLHLEPAQVGLAPPRVHLYVVQGSGVRRRTSAEVYRRRRLVAGLVALIMVVALALSLRVAAAELGGDPASAPEPRSLTATGGASGSGASSGAVMFGGQQLVPGGTYVVQPGDTMWAVARAMQPSGDLEGLVRRLIRLNGGPELDVGERLTLPG